MTADESSDNETEEDDASEEDEEEPPVVVVRPGRGRGKSSVTLTSSGTVVTSRRKTRDDSWKLTTSLDGGPLKPDLLIGFLGHVAYKVWNGQERGPLKSPSKIKMLNKWDLFKIPQAARDFIMQKRWHPETKSFHMLFGEMTITLHDVAFMLQIPINGQAIVYTGDTLKIAAGFLNKNEAQLKASSLEWRNGALKFSSIRACVEKDDVNPSRYATAYLLFLLGATLFADKTENAVNAQFLPLLLGLKEVRSKSWGSAALAFLYRQLGVASRADCKEIAGYLTLLQAWIFVYFPRLAPPLNPAWEDNLPIAAKWQTFDTAKSEAKLLQYKRQLDACDESEVLWKKKVVEMHVYELNWSKYMLEYIWRRNQVKRQKLQDMGKMVKGG